MRRRSRARAATGALALAVLAGSGTATIEGQTIRGPHDHAWVLAPVAAVRGEIAGRELEARDAWGRTPLHVAAEFGTTAVVRALLAAGADVEAVDRDGFRPSDALINSGRVDAASLRALLQAEIEAARQRVDAERHRGRHRGARRMCEVPGYPRPANIRGLGFAWCGAEVGFQLRAYAIQAAGGWCAIVGGSSSSQGQIRARVQEIDAACDALDALAPRGGAPCRCPAEYRRRQ